MQKQLYIALKSLLESITGIKYVALWNNQIEREIENVSFNYPACFIEFSNIGYKEILKGQQQVDMTVKIHIAFESYKTEDLEILTLKQLIYSKIHLFSSQDSNSTSSKLLRRAETQNFDHNNIQIYTIDFECGGKDYQVILEPNTNATVTTLVTEVEIIDP